MCLEQARSWPSRLRGDAKQSLAAFGLATILAIGIVLTAKITAFISRNRAWLARSPGCLFWP
jgi:hypothetical protein